MSRHRFARLSVNTAGYSWFQTHIYTSVRQRSCQRPCRLDLTRLLSRKTVPACRRNRLHAPSWQHKRLVCRTPAFVAFSLWCRASHCLPTVVGRCSLFLPPCACKFKMLCGISRNACLHRLHGLLLSLVTGNPGTGRLCRDIAKSARVPVYLLATASRPRWDFCFYPSTTLQASFSKPGPETLDKTDSGGPCMVFSFRVPIRPESPGSRRDALRPKP